MTHGRMGRAAGWLVGLGLALAGPAAMAQPQEGGWRLSYTGYAAGLPALRLTVDYRFSSAGYAISMRGQSTGVVRVFYHADWQTLSVGTWTGAGIAPQRFENEGTFGGRFRHVVLGFDGTHPEVRQRVPEDDGEHLPLPPGAAEGSVDSLGAMALAVRSAGAAGGCGGQIRTFDGRKVEEVTLRAEAPEVLPATGRSVWHGEGERCEITAQVVAGFDRDDGPAGRMPHTDTMWLAPPAPGAPALPVRMTLSTRRMGHMILYLSAAAPIGAAP